MQKLKILALKFKYLGDIVIWTPALRALRSHFPTAEIHLLVSDMSRPIIDHLPYIDKVWSISKKKGIQGLKENLPIIQTLRSQKFDLSIDFVSNDRGAIFSWLINAKKRYGVIAPKGFWGRSLCYHTVVEEADYTKHEAVRDFLALSPLNIPPPDNFQPHIYPNPSLLDWAQSIIPNHPIIIHISTRQPKKECSLNTWINVIDHLDTLSIPYLFATGTSPREINLMESLLSKRPHCKFLPTQPSIEHFIPLLARAQLVIANDTFALHLANALQIPTIGLFGPTASSRWAPLSSSHITLQSPLPCLCSGHADTCYQKNRCLDAISANTIISAINTQLQKINS